MDKRLDMFNNVVEVGDIIAFPTPNYSGMSEGKIIKFTPKGVSIKYKASRLTSTTYNTTYQLYGSGFIKVPTSYLFIEM